MLAFTIIGILIGIVIFSNYYWGCTLVVVAKLLIPPIVRFQFSSFDISFSTFLVMLLCCSFILQKKYNQKSPKHIFKYLTIFIISSFIIIPFAPVIPYSLQVSSNIQFIITELLLACFIWYGIKTEKQIKQFCIIFLCVTLIICIYGLFTYIWKANPYMDILTLTYEPMQFISFMKEDRGILDGRISATMPHPLSWGQFLGIITACFLLFKIHFLQGKTFLTLLNKICITTICITLFLINIFLTGSRTVLATTFIVFSYSFLSLSISKRIVLTFTASMGLVLILLIPTQNNSELEALKGNIFFWDSKAADQAGIKGSSSELRKDQLSSVFSLVSGGHQFFGLGKGLVENRQSVNVRIKNIENLYGFESIIYYKIAEQGIVGLLFFLLLYFQIYLYIRKVHVKTFDNSTKYLVDALYISYLFSIILTGIQSTFSYFLIATMIYLKFLEIKQMKIEPQTNL